MKIYSRIVSVILTICLISSLSPMLAVAADSVSKDLIDSTLGNLGDKGEFYVSGSSLPSMVTINENEKNVTYSSSPAGIVNNNGSIVQKPYFQYVTVTPIVDGIEGSSQRLLILPKKWNEEMFESFEGNDFQPEEGNSKTLIAGRTYNGWELSNFTDYVDISSVKDNSGNTNIKMEVAFPETAKEAPKPLTITKDVSWKNEGKIVVSMRLKAALGTGASTFNIAMHPISSVVQKTSIAARKLDGTTGTVIKNLNITEGIWHDLLFLIDREDTVSDSDGAYSKTEVYLDGVKCGDICTYADLSSNKEQSIRIQPSRKVNQTVELDDIMIISVPQTVEWNCKGYIDSDKLPTTMQVDGVSYPCSFETSNSAVVAQDGTVKRGKNIAFVTVTPKTTVDGKIVKGDERNLLVLPSNAQYHQLLNENFESEEFLPSENEAAKELQANTTVGDWSVSGFNGSATVSVVPDKDDNNYLKIDTVDGDSTGNPGISIPVAWPDEGKVLLYLRAYMSLESTGTNRFQITPAINLNKASTTEYGIDGTLVSSGKNTEDISSIDNYLNSWHDIAFVMDINDLAPDATTPTNTHKKITMYIDGNKIRECYTFATELSMLSLSMHRADGGYVLVDDIYVCRLDENPYLISNISRTNEKLNGYTVDATNLNPKPAKSYIASYDNMGKLVSVRVNDINSKNTEITDLNMDFSSIEKIKIFVWDNTNMKPVGNMIDHTIRRDTPTVHLIGDSIVCNYEEDNERRGWGQYLGQALNNTVNINNRAISGQRADKFITQGHYRKIKEEKEFNSGDILLIKFGNNDQGGNVPIDTYKEYLRTYIIDARNEGLYPALITPGARNTWTKDGALEERASSELNLTLSDYINAINEVGRELQVPVLDVNSLTKEKYTQLGKDACQVYFTDAQHLSPEGAEMMAGLVVEAMKNATPHLYILDKLTK